MSIKIDWPNLANPAEGVYTAGQPDSGQIRSAAEQGIRTVVNLCAEDECGWDEAAVVKETGMRYIHIPVCGPEDICEANARKLHEVLEQRELQPMIVHCGSANRVGALYALQAHRFAGLDPEAALALGRRAGLAGAEPRVRQCILGN